MRVSKTKDHWELSSETNGATSRSRFNTQRDEAANENAALRIKSGTPRERVFGPVAAWLNNNLLRGRAERLTCEWVADHSQLFLVQFDQEGEDLFGVNPFQLRIAPAHQPTAAAGRFLRSADEQAIAAWDKLAVINELWDGSTQYRPMLFYVALSSLPQTNDAEGLGELENDFGSLIGPNNIVVRTSVRAGAEKRSNMRRTEGLTPVEAARSCVETRDALVSGGADANDLAFVAHRFIAARAAAWVRAEPGNPIVEIHSLWGLPDALQYCPYDIWEVHVPTETATEYPDYKPHMLIATDHGGWDYVRIANRFGRSLSIGRREAMDLAKRTSNIAERLGEACHVMWFVGCTSPDGNHFNVPWYWTKAHGAGRNLDRSNYQVVEINTADDLTAFKRRSGSKARFALEVKPNNQELMRDMKFIGEVGKAARDAGVPVILAGSTLAHAYFELTRQGCTVVAKGEKEHSRVRHSSVLGKIVRDKIPSRIAQRKESEVTQKVPANLKRGFLTSKLLEEALEVRNAEFMAEKKVELADLFEVVRALAQTEGFQLSEVVIEADEKRKKAGGFDEGLVLLQTGIFGRDRRGVRDGDQLRTQVLARKVSNDTYELPFTFFGFMEMDQPRSLAFDDFGVRLRVTLKGDKIELVMSRDAEQLELPLDLSVEEVEPAEGRS